MRICFVEIVVVVFCKEPVLCVPTVINNGNLCLNPSIQTRYERPRNYL